MSDGLFTGCECSSCNSVWLMDVEADKPYLVASCPYCGLPFDGTAYKVDVKLSPGHDTLESAIMALQGGEDG